MNRGIFYPDDARLLVFRSAAGKPYRPSNGTEGVLFYGAWCTDCVHERAVRETGDYGVGCPIYGRALYVCDTSDPAYPAEWIYGEDGQPTCAGFEEDIGQPEPRCRETLDLFEAGR